MTIRRKYFKRLSYLVVLIGSGLAHAGSYDDFFSAIERDDPGSIAALLKRGFDANSRNPDGQTGLFLAMRAESLRAAEALLDGPSLEVNAVNDAGESALMMAALRGQLDWTRKLLDRGAQVNKDGWSPLHYAATGPEPKVLQLLLQRGASIDAASPNRTTPLMMAAQYGSEAAVDMLLARGADPRLGNDQKLRAADFARLGGRDKLAARLEKLAP